MILNLFDKAYEVAENTSVGDLLKAQMPDDWKKYLAVRLEDGTLCDLFAPVAKSQTVTPLTFDDPDGRKVFFHSASHLMAMAVKHLFPNAKLAIGPAIPDGFYYDFDTEVPFTTEDLGKIEKEMQHCAKKSIRPRRYTLPRAEAIALMEERGEKYKVEHIGDLDDDARITFYQQGDYIDMCVGPHICYTKALKAFKLTGVSGAYWKGDKDNKMLTRINGVAFATKEELDEHMHMLEEAKKRDHRKIGREMDLFMMRDEAPGFPFFLPNGMILKNTLLDYWREIHHKAGYVEISTPLIMNKQLWKTSGHWDHYKDNMYSTVIDDEEYCIKPMNCPGGVLVYASKPHSYRELPIRAAVFGRCYRKDEVDATHSPMFHQMEGLVVDKHITFADLKGALHNMAVQMYGPGTVTRFRPHHFPFTEPSCEMDVQCHKCGGVGCPTCKGEGWIELLGAGVCNPKVLKMSGIDPDKYSGWAFGMGLERAAMRRFKIADLRLMFENDIRFLEQF